MSTKIFYKVFADEKCSQKKKMENYILNNYIYTDLKNR